MSKVLVRVLTLLLLLASVYWIPVNLALNLPATQAWLNRLQPDLFALHWERGWSLVPLRIHLIGLAADGQTPTAQWQVDAGQVSAALSARALLQGRIGLYDLNLTDLDARLRPLPKRAEDLAALRPYLPVIRNRDPDALAGPPRPPPDLAIELDDLTLTGTHRVWLAGVRADLGGDLGADLHLDLGDGRIGLADADLDLRLDALQIAGAKDLLGDAWVRGRVEVEPFALAELHGPTLFKLLTMNAELDLPVRSLGFLNQLVDLRGMRLDGNGRMRGRLHLEQGDLKGDTDLAIDADRLSLSVSRFAFEGHGTVVLRDDPGDDGDLVIRFATVEASLREPGRGRAEPRPAVHARSRTPAPGADEAPSRLLYTGHDLVVTLDLAASLGPQGEAIDATRIIVDVPEMTVPDIAVYQRLLPPKAGLEIRGGQGRLSGRVEVSRRVLDLDLTLTSAAADLAHNQQRLTGNLALHLAASGQADQTVGETARLNLTGTAVSLGDARLYLPDGEEPPAWTASLTIADGHVLVPLTAAQLDRGAMLSVAERIGDEGFGSLLDHADGRLAADLQVSRLNWIARLLGRPFDLNLLGSGDLTADLRLDDGWLATGTRVTVRPHDLGIRLLDHVTEGAGELTLAVVEGGHDPLLRLDARMTDAGVRHHLDESPELAAVSIEMGVQARRPRPGGHGVQRPGDAPEVRVKIHSARVPDMRVYDAYLSEAVPFRLLGGQASLVGELTFKPGAAKGELDLVAEGLRVKLPREEIGGDLRLDILVHDGDPAERRFDVTGTALMLDRVQVAGTGAAFARPDWHARLEAERALVHWGKPLTLDLRTGITIKDSRPFVALLDNQLGAHPWLDRLLTVEGLAGRLDLTLDAQGARLPYAMLGSPEINVGAKGLMTPDGPEGVVYVRYRDLTGLLSRRHGQAGFDPTDARGRFDAYEPGLPTSGPPAPGSPAPSPVSGGPDEPAAVHSEASGAPTGRAAEGAPGHRHGQGPIGTHRGAGAAAPTGSSRRPAHPSEDAGLSNPLIFGEE